MDTDKHCSVFTFDIRDTAGNRTEQTQEYTKIRVRHRLYGTHRPRDQDQ